MNDIVLTASVAVDKCLYPFDFLYDYLIPFSLADKVQAGQLVMVPFGKGNHKRIAMVYSVQKKELDPTKLKPVSGIAGDGVTMSRELLDLSVWLKENTFCTYFDAIRTILPPGLNFSIRAEYSVAEGDSALLTDSEKALFAALKAAKTEKELSLLLEREDKKILNSLIDKGFLVRDDIMKRHVGDETERMVRLSADFEMNDRLAKLTPKQKAVIETLTDSESASIRELCYLCNVTPVVIKNLIKYQLLEEYTYTVSRAESAYAETVGSGGDITLSDLQSKV